MITLLLSIAEFFLGNYPIYNTDACGFKSLLGLRFFLCPLKVDSLHLPLFAL